jgi:hypothetical protein
MHAGRSTAKASSAMQEVMNHAQVQIGMRIKVMPLARRSSVVAMKFSAPSSEAGAENGDGDGHSSLSPAKPGPASLSPRR